MDTPEELVGRDKTGRICVVVDILRATTTIQAAFEAGADQVWAVPQLEMARELKANQPNLVLAGERGGIAPLGFDLGNSPLEFTAAKIRGKIVAITTTNGTRALAATCSEDRLFAGFLACELADRGYRLCAKAKEAKEEWMANLDLSLENRLIGSSHGQTLSQLGFALDVRFAAQWNTSARVAQFFHAGDRNIWMSL